MIKMSAAAAEPMSVMTLPRRAIFSCKGVCPPLSAWISRAINPNSVLSPTFVTTILPVPPVTKQPE